MALSILLTVLGTLLIVLTYFDVFLTVLHPQAESPFSSRLQRAMWRGLRGLARPLRGRQARHQLLGLAVPLMIMALVGVWIGLLLFAFAMIYAPWIDGPGAFRHPDGGTTPGWGDALYFSGVTLSTVGYGDIQPVHPLLRFVAVIEGFSGIGVLSLSIAYVLEVYPVLQRKGVLAVLLNEETDGQVQALPLLARYLRNGNFEALAGLLRLVNGELLLLAEAHRRLPILHYAHPPAVERSFLRVLLVVQQLVGALRYGLAGGVGRAWADDPRVRALEDSLFYTLYTLGSSLHLPLLSAPGDAPEDEAATQFQELCARLALLGLPTPSRQPSGPDAASEWERAQVEFARFYTASERALQSYLRNSGYSAAEARARTVRPQKLVSDLEADIE